jgi:5'-nucleotidase
MRIEFILIIWSLAFVTYFFAEFVLVYFFVIKNEKEIVYVDLDGVLANYDKAKIGTTEDDRRQPGFFEGLEPITGGIDAFKALSEKYDVYFLSTAPWSNIHSLSEKRIWVEKHLGEYAFKRLILSHNKGLLKGDYLIDDRIANGVDKFEGEHIHFGTEKFPDWKSILKYLLD